MTLETVLIEICQKSHDSFIQFGGGMIFQVNKMIIESGGMNDEENDFLAGRREGI